MGKINAVIITLILSAGLGNAGTKDFQRQLLNLERLFSVPAAQELQGAQPAAAAPEVLYEKVIPIKSIKNAHYITDFKKVLGKDKVSYSISGQEERPEGISLFGPLTLLITGADQKPVHFELNAIKNKAQQKTFGGSVYDVIYEPKGLGLRPDQGKIRLTAVNKDAESFEIPVLGILEAVYSKSKPLQKVPIRVGFFTKLANLKNEKAKEEYWVMLLKDGMKPESFSEEAGNFTEFKRLHVDASALPVNIVEGGVWKTADTLPVKFDSYTVELSLVHETKTEDGKSKVIGEHLFIKVSR